jgi:pilus assembly protein CpaE
VRTPDTELWRRAALAGVRDIVAPNTPLDEVRVSMAAAMARAERQRSIMSASTAPTSRVVVVLSPKGGSGKTMVSTNLAVALTRGGVNEVALVDLDCTFGDVSSVLGMVPDRTIGQLAALPAIDPTTVKVFLTRHVESGVQVMAGSGLPEEGEAVTAEVARQVIDTMAREFPFVVVDTAAGLDERALAAIDMATDLVFVASMDVTSIRNLGKEIDALDRLGATTARRLFVLNRADARVGLELHDVERALAMPVTASLPSSRLVPLSMNQGRTLVQSEPSSPVSQQIIQVARLLDPNVEPSGSAPEIDARKGLFRRKAT